MKDIKFVNAKGDIIEFSSAAPFILQKFENTNNINIYDNKGMGQHGTTYLNNTLDKRDITLQYTMIAYDTSEIINLRNRINKIFNPKLGSGHLIYKDGLKERKLKCIIERLPFFEPDNGNLFQKGILTLTAHDPFWRDIYETGEQIITWIGGWKFKFKLPFKFKTKGETKKIIYNSGHVDTPIEVVFRGPAVNPSIINHTTGEFIKVNRTLNSDDTLIITTAFGNKRVEIERNRVRVNAFNYIDLDSTFFSLEVGDNLIEYTTESLEPQSVEIKYRNRYLGV